jgi:hypothetical protein
MSRTANIGKIIVIYKTKYGTTKRYAEWIANELDASLFEAGAIKPEQLANYDVVIYGGGLYAGGIAGIKLVTQAPSKSLVVFTVGAADPAITDYSAILCQNFTSELLSRIKVFHLRGGIDYPNLGVIHKGMMAMRKKVLEKKTEDERSSEDRAFIETYGSKIDFTDKSTIQPLVEYVRTL